MPDLPPELTGAPPWPLPAWVPSWREQLPLFGVFCLMVLAGPLLMLVAGGKVVSPRGIDVFGFLGPLLLVAGPLGLGYQVLVMSRMRWRLQHGTPAALVVREIDATGPIWRLGCSRTLEGPVEALFVHTRQLARLGPPPQVGDLAVVIDLADLPRPLLWGFRREASAD